MNYYYITGTSSGIGKALALALLKNESNKVIGISRRSAIEHKNYLHISLDLGKSVNIRRFRFEKLKVADRMVLINNAGTLGDVKYFGKMNSNLAVYGWMVNVVAPGVLMNEFIKTYRKLKGEKIVINISSGAGKSPVDGWGIYCSSKAAIEMMTEVAAKEQNLKNEGFRILAVSPGIVDTEMQEKIRESDQKDFSRVRDFVNYKEKQELADPDKTAQKLIQLINNINEYPQPSLRLQY